MITQFYNTHTRELVGQPREGWYMVDGQPGVLPPELVQLQIVELPYPELAENQVANRALDVIDLNLGTLTRGWTVSTVEPQPWRVSGDTMWNRIKEAIGAENAIAAVGSMTEAQKTELFLNRWFWNTNQQVRAFIAALGLDADAILAPDPFI